MAINELAQAMITNVITELKRAAWDEDFGNYPPIVVAARETSIIRLYSSFLRDLLGVLEIDATDAQKNVPVEIWAHHNVNRHVSDQWKQARWVTQHRQQGLTLQEACERSCAGQDEWPSSPDAVEKAYKRCRASNDPHKRFDYKIDPATLTVTSFDMFDAGS